MSEHQLNSDTETVVLANPHSMCFADRDDCDLGHLNDRDLVVYLALVEHTARRLRSEQQKRASQ